jgi:hypothetical protein
MLSSLDQYISSAAFIKNPQEKECGAILCVVCLFGGKKQCKIYEKMLIASRAAIAVIIRRIKNRTIISPLLAGEGRGEGESSVRYALPVHGEGGRSTNSNESSD